MRRGPKTAPPPDHVLRILTPSGHLYQKKENDIHRHEEISHKRAAQKVLQPWRQCSFQIPVHVLSFRAYAHLPEVIISLDIREMFYDTNTAAAE